MSFVNPAALGLGLLLPVIVVFYLLKLRREERPISSTYLWQRMVRDMQANAPWQRLQRNLLLILQLLFLIAVTLAAGRPFLWAEGIKSQAVIFIFDVSASMGASDIIPSRLEAAKSEAKRIIERLPAEARITLITAGSQPHTLLSLSSDRNLANRAINQIKVMPTGSELGPALQIASAIARRQTDSQTVVFTDSTASLPERAALPENTRVESYGEGSSNQGIAMLSLERNPADGSLTGFAQAANYSDVPAERRIIFYADGVLVNAVDLSIAAHSSQPAIVSGIISKTQIVEARLSSPVETPDFLSIDDQAFAAARTPETSKILLVSSGNIFLETALSLIPEIGLELVDPGSPIEGNPSVVIYDRSLPDPEDVPQANLFFIAPPASTEFFTRTGELQSPIPVLAEPVDPLVEDLELKSVSILDSGVFSLPSWAKPLIVDTDPAETQYPLLFAGEFGDRRVSVMAFDLTRTDLPLQVSFPIMISRMMSWLAPTGVRQIPAAVNPGDPVQLLWNRTGSEASISEAKVIRPDGSIEIIDLNSENPVIEDTTQVGIYRVDFPDQDYAYFSVNLFSPQESAISPGKGVTAANAVPTNAPGSQPLAKQEWWRLAGVLGLVILLIEWLVFYRAAVLRLWTGFFSWQARKRQI